MITLEQAKKIINENKDKENIDEAIEILYSHYKNIYEDINNATKEIVEILNKYDLFLQGEIIIDRKTIMQINNDFIANPNIQKIKKELNPNNFVFKRNIE